MMVTLGELFERLWERYVAITPQAERIHSLLRGRGERFQNDHVALRTFEGELGMDCLAAPFVEHGYVCTGGYRFDGKRLRARSYSHPSGRWPRVFISELVTAAFNDVVPDAVAHCVQQARGKHPLDMLLGEPPWAPVPYPVYQRVLAESEYAAWTMAFGICANHFTVHFNDLRTFADLADLNAFLIGEGFELNGEGDFIQGSPEDGLEQSSTRADTISWTFSGDEVHPIRSCYYEFAKRHTDSFGQLFDGFVTNSANRIFESTNIHAASPTSRNP